MTIWLLVVAHYFVCIYMHLTRSGPPFRFPVVVLSPERCPSGDDPRTTVDETNCWNVTATGGYGKGARGNQCQVDCSNRGLCDYKTGSCSCFIGYYGQACETYSVLSTKN